ncbi:MAG: chorismate mutase [Gammaproteobacteria bacterium]|nr:chorismate mutase [Pseudomonadales bacterium]MCP5347287.1 chorismate mutase [Pseudomonadales bacterium]
MAEAPIPEQLLEVREKIDQVDRQLVLLLAERFALTGKVGRLKADGNLEAVDPTREAQKLEALRELSRQHELNPDLVAGLFTRIMAEVVENHRRIRGENS